MEFLDEWREYFRASGSDIITVIENAIAVARRDDPEGFASKRDRIVGLMYSPQNIDGRNSCRRNDEVKVGGSNHESAEMATKVAEEIEKIEDEDQLLRLKNIFENHEKERDDFLMESLNAVKSIPLTAEIISDTLIGKAVNGLRKHRSRQIRTLATEVVKGWKSIVSLWLDEKETKIDETPSKDAADKPHCENAAEEIRRQDIETTIYDDGFPENLEDFDVDKFFDSIVINDLDDGILDMEEFSKIPIPIDETAVLLQQQQQGTFKVKRIMAYENQNDAKKLLSSGEEQHEKNLQHKEKIQKQDDGGLKETKESFPKNGGSKATHSSLKNTCKIGNNSSVKETTKATAKSNEAAKQKPSPPVQKKNKSPADNKGDLSVEGKLDRTKRKLHEMYKEKEEARKRVKILDPRHLPSQCIKDTSKRRYTRIRPQK